MPKTCLEVTCPTVEEATVQAIYLCLTLTNFTTRFDPEFGEAAVRAALVAQARLAENELLSTVLGGSTLVTATGDLGAARDVLEALDRSAAYLRSRHRLADDVPLRWVAPRWVLNALRADIVRQHASGSVDAFEVADQQLLDWFNLRRIRPTWHADGLAEQTVGATTVPAQAFAAATAEGALPGYPSEIDSALFTEGDWIALDGGVLDLGVVRDSTLNSENRNQVFSETFEKAAFTGAESLRLLIDTGVTALSAGTSPA